MYWISSTLAAVTLAICASTGQAHIPNTAYNSYGLEITGVTTTEPLVEHHMHVNKQYALPDPSRPQKLPPGGQDQPLGGDVWPVAIFWTEIQIGNPPQTFPVAIDSGSMTLDIPHVTCTQCIHTPPNNVYDPSQSKSSVPVPCTGLCIFTCMSNQCYFSNTYQTCDLTNPTAPCTITGLYYTDEYTWGGYGPINVTFGAITTQTSNFDQFKNIDGVMGLAGGVSDGNVFAQLVQAGKIKQNIFGVCFNEGATSNGTITLGGVDPSLYTGSISYSPNTGAPMYGMQLNSITVYGQAVANAATGNAILDSGTNVLLVPDEAFASFKSIFQQAQCNLTNPLPGICDGAGNATLFDSKCFSFTPDEISSFPQITLNLQGVTLVIDGHDYLNLLDPLDPSHYCLGIRPTGPGGFLIIGDTIMERYYVVFDNVKNQIGWAPVNKKNCGSIPL